ncbi:MAG: radical SAM family heme chaperone HemW [Nitrospirae bacterium]|nr:radical SAM family heme chaperone HemW [Nitrospirota bacterium]
MTLSREIGLYIHVPFCRQRCHFCAFYLEIGRPERIAAFCSALRREIDLYCQQGLLAERTLQSIYFGGGTPTALPASQLVALLELIQTTWPPSTAVEVTVEAHPSTVTAKDLRILADAGINRISFGAESMDDKDFAPIGRPGNVRDTETAVAAARAASFTNINLDLMYGLPGQSLEAWTKTLQLLLMLDPSHVSCYALTIEEGTRLAQDIARDLALRPEDALQVDMESAAETLLSKAGFIRYEISNYAKPGAACRHNLLYWTDHDYLGLGPSAQSYVDGVRFGNIADLTAYVDMLDKHRLPVAERIILSASERQRDALVFGLRLLRGVPLNNVDGPEQRHRVNDLVTKGLLESDADRVRLTSLGQRYADTVAGELF